MENDRPPVEPPIEPLPPTTAGEPVAASGSFRRPADYYSAPLPPDSGKSGCPKWVPIGCGLGGCLVLVLMFVGGTIAVRDGSGRVSNWFVSRVQSEMLSMLAPDVSPAERVALQQQLDLLQKNITERKASLLQMQQLLQTMNGAISDRKVTREEAQSIRKELEDVNRKAAGGVKDKPESVDL